MNKDLLRTKEGIDEIINARHQPPTLKLSRLGSQVGKPGNFKPGD